MQDPHILCHRMSSHFFFESISQHDCFNNYVSIFCCELENTLEIPSDLFLLKSLSGRDSIYTRSFPHVGVISYFPLATLWFYCCPYWYFSTILCWENFRPNYLLVFTVLFAGLIILVVTGNMSVIFYANVTVLWRRGGTLTAATLSYLIYFFSYIYIYML